MGLTLFSYRVSISQIPRFAPERRNATLVLLPDGLCVEVLVPISLPVLVQFSMPVLLDDEPLGLWVELVLPIPSALGEPASPFCPAEGEPPV